MRDTGLLALAAFVAGMVAAALLAIVSVQVYERGWLMPVLAAGVVCSATVVILDTLMSTRTDE